MDFLPEDIEKYVEQHTQEESDLLKKLNRETQAKVLMPRMLSGHLQGRALAMFSKMIKPKNILEIGTYTGYSAICLYEGIADGGKLISIDINAELEDWIKEYWEKAELKRAELKIGNALDIIPDLNVKWDLVFIDADKSNYSNYYDLVIEHMNPGSYIIADNVLWSGKVTQEPEPNDKDTPALIEFNKKIQNDDRVENVLFPIRDGLMVIRKK